jgi:hypothetical protein
MKYPLWGLPPARVSKLQLDSAWCSDTVFRGSLPAIAQGSYRSVGRHTETALEISNESWES